MSKVRCILVLFLFSLIFACNVRAQWVQTNGPYGGVVKCFAVTEGNLFAGTEGGVFLSTDNGSTWTAVNNGINACFVSSLLASDTNLFAGTYGDGVFRSTDNGTSWTPADSGLSNSTIDALVVSGDNLFAGSFNGGVFRSTDNGSSWTAVNSGLTNTEVLSFAVSGTSLFAGTWGNGVFRSTNNGSSWAAVNDYGLNSTYVYALTTIDSNLFAGTSGAGIFRSSDNGSSWNAVNNGLTDTVVQTLVASGTNLYAGTYGDGVFLSTDYGSSWTALNTGLPQDAWNSAVMALTVSGTNLFAGTWTGGVFLSTNNGTSWTPVDSGLTNTSNITYIASLATNGIYLFVGTAAGVGISSSANNRVGTRARLGMSSLENIGNIRVGGRLFSSTVGGAVWRRPLTEMITFSALQLSPKNLNFDKVRIGQFKDTTLTIRNTGNDTARISNITSSRPTFTARPTVWNIAPGKSLVDTLRFSPSAVGADSALVVIKSDSIISPGAIKLSGVASAPTSVECLAGIPKTFVLSQNFPNPFNPATTLHYGLPTRSRVRLQVYNLLGQAVADLVNTEQTAGWKQVVWNANVSSGIYFYRLEAVSVSDPNSRFVDVKKIILLK